MGPPVSLRVSVVCLWTAVAALFPSHAPAVTVNGDATYTTDYIFRGISQTDGHGAGQLDVHLATLDGTFAGVFGSTLGRVRDRYWSYELEEYVGHRFDLSPSWSTSLSVVNYSYFGGNVPISNDYQELTLSASYLDRWTLSVSSSPNVLHFNREYRLGRYPGYVAEASTQLPIVGRLFFTAGIGYYQIGSGMDGLGYLYGNGGVAFEYKSLRIEGGYYAVQEHAQPQYPWGWARNRVAGTLSWHF